MPGGENEQARKRDRCAIEKGVEAWRLLVKLEDRSIHELDEQASSVRVAHLVRTHAADVGPASSRDALATLPQRKARCDDDDASERIEGWRVEAQLLAKPGRTRTCDGFGSKITAAMLS